MFYTSYFITEVFVITEVLVHCWVMLKHENFIKQCYLINYEVALSKQQFGTVNCYEEKTSSTCKSIII